MARVLLPLRPVSDPTPGGLPGVSVRTLDGRGNGWDLTPHVDGLRWSSVNPGGDEACSFELAREWFAGAPEVKEGNLCRVMAGPDVLWQGRVEENRRSVERAEMIGVTALGTGVRLRDSRMREIYRDAELGAWTTPPSLGRQEDLSDGTFTYKYKLDGEASVGFDESTQSPGLVQRLTRVEGDEGAGQVRTINESWYDAAGVPIGAVYYTNSQWDRGNTPQTQLTAANWVVVIHLSTDDLHSSVDSTADLAGSPGSALFEASTDDRVFATIQIYTTVTTASDGEWKSIWRNLVVYGRHGLAKQGTDPGGFLASQIAADAVGRVAGITVRRLDQGTYIISQAAFKEPTEHEGVVREAARYESVDWGTWGPDQWLDFSTDGYFDWTAQDRSTAAWTVRRADCESVGLGTELSAVFNEVDVHFTDHAGNQRVTTRTAAVPALDSMDPPLQRRQRVDGGTLAPADADTLGDVFLAIFSAGMPARGDFVVSRPIRHAARGLVPPWFMRADGSNVRMIDVLPSRELFDLAGDGGRSIFPVERVEVDFSQAVPRVSVQVDQAIEDFSVLQARLAQGQAT